MEIADRIGRLEHLINVSTERFIGEQENNKIEKICGLIRICSALKGLKCIKFVNKNFADCNFIFNSQIKGNELTPLRN